MKRSEVNRILRESVSFFQRKQFHLPPWAQWRPDQWKGHTHECAEIIQRMLGWDITDFGGGSFPERGLLLFTLRNGDGSATGKPYAEKIMIVQENQETPFHFHWNKMEDIINRGGGNLQLELYPADENDGLGKGDLEISIDGIRQSVPAGSPVTLHPGESITLNPRVYHRFFGESGLGPVLTGEVSMVNDDDTDNRFLDPLGRFPEIIEDEPPLYLLAQDYRRYI